MEGGRGSAAGVMRTLSFSTVLAIAALLGVAAFGWTLFRSAPDPGAGPRRGGAMRMVRPSDPEGLRDWIRDRPRDTQGWRDYGTYLAATGREEDLRAHWSQWNEWSERAVLERPDDPWTWYAAGWSRRLLERDDAATAFGRAASLFEIEAAAETLPGDSYYNLACCRALMGETDAALVALERAAVTGWSNRDWAARDPDLESLREDQRFKDLLDRLPRLMRVSPG